MRLSSMSIDKYRLMMHGIKIETRSDIYFRINKIHLCVRKKI